MLNVERKYIDVTATVASTTTAAFVNLNACQLGTSSVTRVGQSIKVVSIYVNLFWVIGTAQVVGSYQRVLIFRDRQANGAAPAATDVLVSSNVLAPNNIGNSKRFKIIFDTRNLINTNGNEYTRFRKFKRLSFHTEYNTGNAGTVADQQTNSLYMMHLSDQAAGTNNPTLSYYIRTRFIDN